MSQLSRQVSTLSISGYNQKAIGMDLGIANDHLLTLHLYDIIH